MIGRRAKTHGNVTSDQWQSTYDRAWHLILFAWSETLLRRNLGELTEIPKVATEGKNVAFGDCPYLIPGCRASKIKHCISPNPRLTSVE